MKIEVKIPEVGESVQEALLAEWFKRDGDRVAKDEVLFVIETDKVTLEIAAEADGILHIEIGAGETVSVGTTVATIETEAAGREGERTKAAEELRPETPPGAVDARQEPQRPEEKTVPAESGETRSPAQPQEPAVGEDQGEPPLSPAVRRLVSENQIDVAALSGSGPGGRITKGDVLLHLEGAAARQPSTAADDTEAAKDKQAAAEDEEESAARSATTGTRRQLEQSQQTTRKAMTPIRQKIAQRLLEARQNTAMLTTFNEIDMSRVQETRGRFKQKFQEKYGISLGIMSFFIKAAVAALKEFPEVNAVIEGKDIVYHHYYHIGVAVGGERGLVVPVIRHADGLTFAEIERAISDYVHKIKENRLEISDLEGGTFTISNGGVYGSLLSTPILNTPQSGILGMHKIEERPVVVDGEITIRPMMYVALSYDHRIVDGREAVSFLKRIKKCVEQPERIMLEI
ncbi:2-oxoglutarate dehydrogenase complex dihydrolipoyllysine-residue succinyltransferase [Desulfoferrobacter suflitae]|uniref:2-oxoglutarate dehydrogenase complex dihydrolipoyllysine-residue succinyltransferase n=1 Tax=Desulfoferrobacter suflitae TaxID=2865782 RepID=UPI002164DB3A|nr:2-oxoglutarate dehydrogenase complex dihydrolipoyllysine-residue succinyltransferase [Desulfoferrobacter suflitae]MCK8600737.1 2-oxoglutarate dehydrogenase complex dihydrolipoyllysine-residue succinyltransferase [Desulfoferrobacter suflitae]